MSYTLHITLPGLPLTQNTQLKRRHWGHNKRDKDRWIEDVGWAVLAKGKPGKPLERARVVMTRHSSSAIDSDGLAASFKGARDGLVRAGVLRDDGPECATFEYRWQRAPRGKGFVTIEVEEVS